MWKRFYNWCVKYQDQITWFLIGYLTAAALDNLAKQEFIAAAIYGALVYANYFASKIKLQ